MAEYRKKPIEVEARQYCDCHPEAILEWAGAHFIDIRTDERDPENPNEFLREKVLTIRTLEGEMVVSPGDWVIRGIAGEFYPCKPAIFDATYEPVPVVSGSTDNPTSPADRPFRPTLSYYPDVRAGYIALQPSTAGIAKRTEEVPGGLNIDYDRDGEVVGYEFILPAVAGSTEPATDRQTIEQIVIDYLDRELPMTYVDIPVDLAALLIDAGFRRSGVQDDQPRVRYDTAPWGADDQPGDTE